MSEAIPEQVLTPESTEGVGGGHIATVAGWSLAKSCSKRGCRSEEVLHLYLEPNHRWPNQVIIHRGCSAHWFAGQNPIVGVNWIDTTKH